ncbi:MAG: hypothetical protein HLUCCA01_08850 [Bacteroidetes bacterium HLUCCA01]|nr:MAG: hypothetical protein HLUCCA01_08850 [Bacteroidetes bacterium HLUCCA01]
MKYSALTGSILAMVLAAVYVNLGWWMQQEGFFSSEALFYVAKADMFYSGIVPRLAVFGVTFPLLPFQAVLVLFPLTGLFTPVVASALGMAFLFRFLWSVAEKRGMEWGWKLGLLVIFLANPGFLYAAMSGQSIYLLLIFFSGFLYYMLTYLDEPSTFSIAMAGVFYTGIIFVQFSYVWIFVFILPVLLLISLRGVEVESVRNQLTLEILFDDSYRRNLFVRKVLATSFLLLILPAGALALYMYYNHLFAGYSMFFLNSASVNAELISSRSIESVPGIQQYYFFSLSNLDFALLLLTAVPFATLLLITSLKDPLKVYILSIPLLIVFFHLSRENIAIVNMPLFMLVGISVITAAPMMQQQYVSRRNIGRIFLLLSLLSVYFNYTYMASSTHTSEREFVQVALGGGVSGTTLADQEVARWLRSHTGTDKRVMADDATTYRVIAFHGRSEEFVLPMENDFITYLSNPEMASYILVPAAENMFRRFDLLYNQLSAVQDGALSGAYTEVFRNDAWVVFATNSEWSVRGQRAW